MEGDLSHSRRPTQHGVKIAKMPSLRRCRQGSNNNNEAGSRGKCIRMAMTCALLAILSSTDQLVNGFSNPKSYWYSSSTRPSVGLVSPNVKVAGQRLVRPSRSLTTRLPAENNDDNESSNSFSTDESSSSTPFVGLPTYRRILFFVATTVLIWVSEPLLSLVDSAMVGRYAGRAAAASAASTTSLSSVIQLAALGPATMLCDSTIYLTLFIAMATTNKLARAFAKNDVDDQITTLSHVMGVSLVVGTFIALLIIFRGQGLLSSIVGPAGATVVVETAKGAKELVDLTPQVLRAALGYSRIRAAACPIAVMGLTSQAALLCSQDTRTPAIAVAVASICNILGDYLFVAKMNWGVRGAALATSIASLLSNGILIKQAWKIMQRWKNSKLNECNTGNEEQNMQQTRQTPHLENDSMPFVTFPDRKSLIALLKLAGPMFFVLVGKTCGYSAMTIRAGNFGLVSLACHNILMRIFFFYCTFGDGLSHAAQTFLPGLLYRKEETATDAETTTTTTVSKSSSTVEASIEVDDDKNARTLLKRLLFISVIVGCVNSNTARVIANNAGRAFTSDASLVSLMSHVSPLMGLALLIHPVTMTLEGSIIAGRDLKFLVATYVASISVLLGKLKLFCGDFAGVWKALVLFQLVRICQFGGRVMRRTAASRKRINGADVSDNSA